MGEGDPHAPTMPRKHREQKRARAAIVCIVIGTLLFILAIYIFAFLPMADLPYLAGGLLVGGALVFLYIGADQWKMANFKSEVEDLIERADALLKETGE